MLTHQVSGPTDAGRYLVTYCTPGCSVPTAACECVSIDQAQREAKRLNELQRTRELALRSNRTARGLSGTHPGLGVN